MNFLYQRSELRDLFDKSACASVLIPPRLLLT